MNENNIFDNNNENTEKISDEKLENINEAELTEQAFVNTESEEDLSEYLPGVQENEDKVGEELSGISEEDSEKSFAEKTEREEVYINCAPVESEAKDAPELKNKPVKKKRKLSPVVLVAALCVLLSGLAAFGGTYLAGRLGLNNGEPSIIYRTVYKDSGTISNTDSTFGKVGTYADVAANVAGSVVEIRTETVSTSSIFSQYITKGAGSGVIITSDGYIITNNHVIEGATTVTVYTKDGTKYSAEVIGFDVESDLAVLKIEATGLVPAVVGDSTKLVVGEEVIAIGNPLGSLGGTVTNGIISALARQVTIDGTEMTLLQTNAAVNPGNSGGGLFNLAGELIGIVNAKSSGSGIEGLGFAIPSNMASQVVEQLINYGYVRGRVSLGISYMDISDSYTAMMYRVNTLGVYILESEYNDELKIGDRVTAVDGTEVTYASDIKAILKDHKVGDKVTLTVVRDGKYVDVEMECHEYVPAKDEEEKKADVAAQAPARNPLEEFFSLPFSSWFGY
ncbi:MAG: trypsin-like peptidase domain-containing protein [Clostridia bacterium]|nr:trypsin-like peptidase domain-containing protein [Clostridia bacterium]